MTRPALSTDHLNFGQCTHPRWFKNGYTKANKQIRCCASCHKKEVVGKVYTREPLLASRLKFVPLWLEGVAPKEAAVRLRVSYHTAVIHYRALRAMYYEKTGEIRRVDGRVANNFTAEARAARLAVNVKVKAVGA